MYNSIYPVNINYHKPGSYRYNKGGEAPERSVEKDAKRQKHVPKRRKGIN